MQIGSLKVNTPIALGPMAGVTDWAFRNICTELGAELTITEMVSSRALCYKDKKSAALLRKTDSGICGAQIFGNNPEIMAQGALLALEISGCDFIDINMGCPMPKIANSGDGCGLMRTPELAGEIVKAVVKAVDVPVTVKCRLGWDKGSINVLDFTKRMEDCGAALLTVHGRTRSMLYSGKAAALRAEGALKRGDAGDDLGAGIHIIKLVAAELLARFGVLDAGGVAIKFLTLAVNDDIRAGNSTGGEGVDEIGEIGEIHFYTP